MLCCFLVTRISARTMVWTWFLRSVITVTTDAETQQLCSCAVSVLCGISDLKTLFSIFLQRGPLKLPSYGALSVVYTMKLAQRAGLTSQLDALAWRARLTSWLDELAWQSLHDEVSFMNASRVLHEASSCSVYTMKLARPASSSS